MRPAVAAFGVVALTFVLAREPLGSVKPELSPAAMNASVLARAALLEGDPLRAERTLAECREAGQACAGLEPTVTEVRRALAASPCGTASAAAAVVAQADAAREAGDYGRAEQLAWGCTAGRVVHPSARAFLAVLDAWRVEYPDPVGAERAARRLVAAASALESCAELARSTEALDACFRPAIATFSVTLVPRGRNRAALVAASALERVQRVAREHTPSASVRIEAEVLRVPNGIQPKDLLTWTPSILARAQRMGDLQLAIAVVEALVEADPGSWRAKDSLGMLYLALYARHHRSADLARAKQAFRDVLALEPNDGASLRRARAVLGAR